MSLSHSTTSIDAVSLFAPLLWPANKSSRVVVLLACAAPGISEVGMTMALNPKTVFMMTPPAVVQSDRLINTQATLWRSDIFHRH